MFSGVLGIIFIILMIYNFLFAFLIIFFEKRNPASTWAWLMVVLIIPFFGSLLYLTLGFEARKHKTFLKKASDDAENIERVRGKALKGMDYINKQADILSREKPLGSDEYGRLNDFLYLNYKSGGGALTFGNAVDFFFEGEEKFESLLRDIAGAKSFVHMEYYIFRRDELGKRIMSALTAKAREGVEVCLLIDGMGTSFVPKSFFNEFKASGGRLAVFIPPRFIRLNYRNHRKLSIIDGTIGYIGGLNIGDEYIGKKKRFGHWRDAHLRIYGEAVKELELRFMLDWNHISNHTLAPDDKYYPAALFSDGVPTQIVSSGPDTKWPSVYHACLKMFGEAERSIYIQTPYFVPDDAVLEALRLAALSGIDVRIVIPRRPDHFFVYWASASYLSELVGAGVRCYEYDDGFLHSKLVVIDGSIVSIGSANMDVRSFKLNFEVNAFLFDSKAAGIAEKRFLDDLESCVAFDQATIDGRKWHEKIKEAFSRLISPLL